MTAARATGSDPQIGKPQHPCTPVENVLSVIVDRRAPLLSADRRRAVRIVPDASASGSVRVRAALHADVAALAPLFDAYRVFYAQPSDAPAARRFLTERLDREDAALRVAVHAGSGEFAGFTTLHRMHALVQLGPLYILEDLYVRETMRRAGVATALLADARALAEANGAVGIVLSTHRDNVTAQRVYERTGYVRDDRFFHYALTLDSAPHTNAGE